jgi:hypothetical protein
MANVKADAASAVTGDAKVPVTELSTPVKVPTTRLEADSEIATVSALVAE